MKKEIEDLYRSIEVEEKSFLEVKKSLEESLGGMWKHTLVTYDVTDKFETSCEFDKFYKDLEQKHQTTMLVKTTPEEARRDIESDIKKLSRAQAEIDMIKSWCKLIGGDVL